MLCGVVAGCQQGVSSSDDKTASGASAPVTASVKRQDLVGYAFFDGKLVIPTSARAEAYSPYATPVVSISTDVGRYVARGEPLVKLAIPGADAAEQRARASTRTAKATYSEETDFDSEPVKEAEQALAVAKADEKSAEDAVSAGGKADVARAKRAREDAEAALLKAKQKLKEAVAPEHEEIASSSAQLFAAKADEAKGIVRAPISGTVVAVNAKQGSDAHARQSLVSLINYYAARVQGAVPPALKGFIVQDAHVMITMDGPSAEPVEGKVLGVTAASSAHGESAPGYVATIEFLYPARLVQPVTRVKRIGVKTGEAKQVLVVPVGSVLKKDGLSHVNVLKGSKWLSTPVETGISDGTLVEIRSGLSEGDTVQVSGE